MKCAVKPNDGSMKIKKIDVDVECSYMLTMPYYHAYL